MNPFLDESLRALPRLIGCLNRNELSPTFGSFDRNYWHYRTITAFESATFCQGVLPLALAYRHEFFGKEYHRNPTLLSWIDAALRRWTKLQHDDGSFDEWYPHERSHVATAFTTFAVSEALIQLRGALKPETEKLVLDSLVISAHWLSDHLDDKVLNHTAGAIPAIHNVMKLSGDDSLQRGLKKNLELMREKQSDEGWFMENGGFDAGYLSLSIDFLGTYHAHSGDTDALAMRDRGLKFLRLLVHPDGSSGGEYAARNTKYLMPRGLLEAAEHNGDALEILRRYLPALEDNRAVMPCTTDDRYTIFFFLPNFMRAALLFDRVRSKILAAPPQQFHGAQSFAESGLLVRGSDAAHLVMNCRKAGCFRLFCNVDGRWIAAGGDGGYFLRDWLGRVASSQYLVDEDDKVDCVIRQDGSGEITILTALKSVNYSLPLEKFQIPFLTYAFTLGRLKIMNTILEKVVKNVFIRKPARSRFHLERRIVLTSSRVVIRDRITGRDTNPVEIRIGGIDTAPHVPSSRYFVPSDLSAPAFERKCILPFEMETVIDLESGTITRKVYDENSQEHF